MNSLFIPKNLKNFSRAGAAVAISLALSSAAQAYLCKGKVTHVQTGPDGSVNAGFENTAKDTRIPWAGVCNVNDQAGRVSPAACKQILKTLQLAFVTKKDVDLYFNYDQPTGSWVHDAWTNLSVPGRDWYWGPVIMD
jgi:hypothetical protein